MRFADRVSRVSPSVTLGLNARTLELRGQGKDIVALGVGEPDIDTPEVICDAAKLAIDRRQCRYTATAGIPELRKAIRTYVKNLYGVDYAQNCVMASSGAKQVLFNAMMAVAGDGDEVIVPAPYWTSYPEFVYLAGARPVAVTCPAKDGLKLTPAGLEAALTPNTTAILINSPGNPSGVTYDRAELEALAEVLKPTNVWVISDDIYCTLLYGDTQFTSFAMLPGWQDRTIVVNGVSKTFSMTGWRIGFAAGSREVIAAMTKIQDHSTSCPNSVAQRAAAVALEAGPKLTAEWMQSLQGRRDLMASLLEDIPGIVLVPCTGAFYLFADLSRYLGPGGPADTMELCQGLLEQAGVGVIPGEAFGAPGFIRLSFAVSDDNIREGISRLRNHLESL